jgi:hypothetical protein
MNSEEVVMRVICNMCGGEVFENKNNRIAVQCSSCGSLERTRLLKLYLDKHDEPRPSAKVMHFAPEKGIYDYISSKIGYDCYHVFDLKPKRYAFAKNIKRFDLIQDFEKIRDDQYDLVLHSHVIEHIPCNYTYLLYHIHRVLKPTGKHICVIPFLPGHYDESFKPLSRVDATKRFGQHDHLRRFGTNDIENTLGKVIRMPKAFDAQAEFGKRKLKKHNIPLKCAKGFSPDTVLVLRKDDYLLR